MKETNNMLTSYKFSKQCMNDPCPNLFKINSLLYRCANAFTRIFYRVLPIVIIKL